MNKKVVIETDEVVVNRKKKKIGSSNKGIEEEVSINYDILSGSSDDEDESEDEECDQIEKQCNLQLHFDCTSSRTTSSGTSTQTNEVDELSVIGEKAEDSEYARYN